MRAVLHVRQRHQAMAGDHGDVAAVVARGKAEHGIDHAQARAEDADVGIRLDLPNGGVIPGGNATRRPRNVRSRQRNAAGEVADGKHYGTRRDAGAGSKRDRRLVALLDIGGLVMQPLHVAGAGLSLQRGAQVAAEIHAARIAVTQRCLVACVAGLRSEVTDEMPRVVGKYTQARGHDVEQVLGIHRRIRRALAKAGTWLDDRETPHWPLCRQQMDRDQDACGAAADDCHVELGCRLQGMGHGASGNKRSRIVALHPANEQSRTPERRLASRTSRVNPGNSPHQV